MGFNPPSRRDVYRFNKHFFTKIWMNNKQQQNKNTSTSDLRTRAAHFTRKLKTDKNGALKWALF